MRKIVIALNSGTAEQRNEITNYFSSNSFDYWHWIDDMWIVLVSDSTTPKVMHEALEASTNIKAPTMLVFEFTGNIQYWGRNEPEAWSWLSKTGTPG